jgi:3-dehydroquinate dehydratase-2
MASPAIAANYLQAPALSRNVRLAACLIHVARDDLGTVLGRLAEATRTSGRLRAWHPVHGAIDLAGCLQPVTVKADARRWRMPAIATWGSQDCSMTNTIFVLNGPNLSLLGAREPAIYGSTTLSDIRDRCIGEADTLGFGVEFRQTNFEGGLVESVHQARRDACGIIINPAGYTFTSIALLDALKTFDLPKIELHISNVHARESIYYNSSISRIATAVVIGFGARGFELAIQAMAALGGRHGEGRLSARG